MANLKSIHIAWSVELPLHPGRLLRRMLTSNLIVEVLNLLKATDHNLFVPFRFCLTRTWNPERHNTMSPYLVDMQLSDDIVKSIVSCRLASLPYLLRPQSVFYTHICSYTMNAIPMPYLIMSPVFWYLSSNHSDHFQYLCSHIDAAASTAPAALNVLELVILTSTGYIHSMYFPQPKSPKRQHSNLPIVVLETHSSMQTSSQSISRHMVQSPSSRPIPTVVDSPPIPSVHRNLRPRSPDHCCLLTRVKSQPHLGHLRILGRRLG